MAGAPFVSVIIPVYNDARRLQVCLQAIEHQTYAKTHYDVIAVDNGSNENIESVVADFPHARAALESRRGSFAARNTGIRLTRGEVLAFTDSDCIPAPDWLEKGVAALIGASNCAAVGGKIDIFFREPERPTIYELYDSIWHLNQRRYIEKLHFGATANLLAFRHIFNEIGVFDGNRHFVDSDDLEWGQRAVSCGYCLAYADDACVRHPARDSFQQLRNKIIRIAHGTACVDRKTGNVSPPVFNQNFLIGLIPPFRTIRRLASAYNLSIGDQAAFLRMWTALRLLDIRERVNVSFSRAVDEEA